MFLQHVFPLDNNKTLANQWKSYPALMIQKASVIFFVIYLVQFYHMWRPQYFALWHSIFDHKQVWSFCCLCNNAFHEYAVFKCWNGVMVSLWSVSWIFFIHYSIETVNMCHLAVNDEKWGLEKFMSEERWKYFMWKRLYQYILIYHTVCISWNILVCDHLALCVFLWIIIKYSCFRSAVDALNDFLRVQIE